MSIDRVIISGGGTGGHIYPAIAIAKEIRQQFPACQILFVGANGRMEMEKVPQAGFEIKGLTIAGFNRKSLAKNIFLPFKLLKSLTSARRIIRKFNPQVVIGVGGYASGPTLQAAIWLKVPTLIQEQNSFPGKTNLLLAKNTKAICVAYPKMERFFPQDRIYLTGNPVRMDIVEQRTSPQEGISFYNLNPERKTVLVMGGSLGAKTLNQAIMNAVDEISSRQDVQILWQCGRTHFDELSKHKLPNNVVLLPFLERMDFAYAVADVIVSRAGATSISELSIVAKPTILVPSPNVSEDHQTKNAQALTNEGAALLIEDTKAPNSLWTTIDTLLQNPEKCKELSLAMARFALPSATKNIVEIAAGLIRPS
jgi:UDP-N-acetylglucosamine--N-acetylmuramyl-(pentapeptide) pyrophosphoryl-undecaprenol N-acetylglucosamine transferase